MVQRIDVPGMGVVEFPDGMSDDDIASAIRRSMPAQQTQSYDPTEGMSAIEKGLAGTGKAFVDVYRGGKQLLGIGDQQALQKEIDESRRLDAPLMNTTAGTVGNVIGNVAIAAPTAMIPGANTIAGGAALGALSGATQPVATDESRFNNIKSGAIFGAAVPTAIRAGKVVKAGLIDPFTQAGRTRIVGGALNRAAADPAQAAAKMRTATGATPGFMPTAGQAADDAGIASVERTARSIDPGGFGDVDKAQRAALVNALRSVAGSPEERAAAVSQVERQARQLYGDAFKESVPVTPELSRIANRPSMRMAEKRALSLSDELGIPYKARLADMNPQYVPLESPPPTASSVLVDQPPRNLGAGYFEKSSPAVKQVAGDTKPSGFFEVPPVESVPVMDMHTLKMGMDALMADPTQGIAGREAAAIARTRNQLLDQLPESYQLARRSHIEMNRPVNQMDIGKELYQRFVPALADGADVPFKSRADALAQALRNGDDLAKNVTGLKNAKFDQIMAPEQISLLNGIVKDSQMKAAAETAGRGVGSDTVQKMAMSNLVNEAGLPTWIGNLAPLRPAAGILKTVGDLVYSKNDESMRNLLADVLKDPEAAAKAMDKAGVSPSRIAEILKLGAQAPVMAVPSIANAQKE